MHYFKTSFLLITFILLLISPYTFSQNTKANSAAKTDSSKIAGNIFLNHIKFDTISLKNMPELLNDIGQLKLMSGTIYFSGNGFSSTQASVFVGSIPNDGGPYADYFRRCITGSKITLERCTVKNSDGSINKSYVKSIYIK